MSMTNAEKLVSIAYCDILTEQDKDDLARIAARLEQLERENAELKRPALGPNPTARDLIVELLGSLHDSVGATGEAWEYLNSDAQDKVGAVRIKARRFLNQTQPDGKIGLNPMVAEIVRDYLKRNGYDGCYSDSIPKCSCDGSCWGNSVCRAGHIQPDGTIGKERS